MPRLTLTPEEKEEFDRLAEEERRREFPEIVSGMPVRQQALFKEKGDVQMGPTTIFFGKIILMWVLVFAAVIVGEVTGAKAATRQRGALGRQISMGQCITSTMTPADRIQTAMELNRRLRQIQRPRAPFYTLLTVEPDWEHDIPTWVAIYVDSPAHPTKWYLIPAVDQGSMPPSSLGLFPWPVAVAGPGGVGMFWL